LPAAHGPCAVQSRPCKEPATRMDARFSA
jgi:hypothetical protein